MLDREEFVEQVYFFRTFRERLAANVASQEILQQIPEEILSTTRLPLALQYLSTELRHSGQLSAGMTLLGHYFTAFQAYVIGQAELEGRRLTMPTALQVLEREADYKSQEPTRPGLFVYQFEAVMRNRLGYLDGLRAMRADPLFDGPWREYIDSVARSVGAVEFAELIYLRSGLMTADRRRAEPNYEPALPEMFGPKEGKIAKASRGRDPLFLFAALQRQLGYPEVPRPAQRTDTEARLEALRATIARLENRVKLLEGEVSGQVDWSQFGSPEDLNKSPDWDDSI